MFQLLERMECVCRIENNSQRLISSFATCTCNSNNSHSSDGGTGFVGNIVIVDNEEVHFMITCHHVIPDETTAMDSFFMFNHIDDQFVANKIRGTDLFDMKDSKWFWTNEVRRPVVKNLINYIT